MFAENACTDVVASVSSNLVSMFEIITRAIKLIRHLHRLCTVHNQVNIRLGKPEFDCAHLDETYDCGCGDEPVFGSKTSPKADPMDLEIDPSKDSITGVDMIKGGR